MEILANKVRPKILDDIVGQDHLIGENKVLTNLIKNSKLFSMILYGNPGTGKTSIANVIISNIKKHYKFLNAVTNNKNDFDIAIKEAILYNEMILVVDEIHRMNKDKQDILLPHLESGTIILIGLTTSNPYYKINPAIRSRCHIFKLNDLTYEDITKSLKKIAQDNNIKYKKDVLSSIAQSSNGDLRYAINLLELAHYTTEDGIKKEDIKNICSKPSIIGDSNETGHYDMLSALQKSIRGSDPDAAVHYLARLLEFNDLDSIHRRLSVICYEDIGLANPALGSRLYAALELANLVGMPESRIIYGEIVIEMALSPKSNSAYNAINNAINDVAKGNIGPIPSNIEFNNTNYIYPHDYKNHYVKQNYMPTKLKNKKYYIMQENTIENNLNNAYKKMKGE